MQANVFEPKPSAFPVLGLICLPLHKISIAFFGTPLYNESNLKRWRFGANQRKGAVLVAMREIVKMIQGERAIDGAGVHMVRVLSSGDAYDFDPFLMLDSFDSTNPADYTAGFPTHPHRGIETITYLISGKIEHEDSLGNKGAIHAGESQWMTAGSGILHQEMPKAADRMLGFQLLSLIHI